ncbi:family 3 adenylate cyclase [Anoxybacter fermentans]|uniref:Family 3 adenylate cyclase n=1 Tax=Anoxybacter fermentans TaxID=1323375 RepID=A0A3Q9HRK3_9FIRM|nr:adenylate/guanylate cyclase domain-containing protein [Anoxybacter fermentans]AZR74072.1 family 3 adenylate cyclase [Anoxybacter fermentans]
MQTNHKSYDINKSAERIDEILAESNNSFEELDYIPDRSKLTYTNGFYVKVGAIFVDIRQSSELTGEHRRPKLAKLYRSYISETVAILNSYYDCKEINIVGDCVSGIFEAQYKYQIENMYFAAAEINSLIKILNYKYRKSDIVEIKVGIGLAYGRALMIKAGYSGSGINEVVWMGDVVNRASNLCNLANKDSTAPILIDENVYINLPEKDQDFFTYNYFGKYYEGNVINIKMQEWYEENCT